MTSLNTSTSSRHWRAIVTTTVMALGLAIGLGSQHAAHSQQNQTAYTAATILAKQASKQWLASDKLGLQALLHETQQLPQIHYAAIVDAADTLISERGNSQQLKPKHTYSANIMIGDNQVGRIILGFNRSTMFNAWWLLLLAPLLGLIQLMLTAPAATKPQDHAPSANTSIAPELPPTNDQPNTDTATSDAIANTTICLIVALKHPPIESEWQHLQQLADHLNQYYPCRIDVGVGYFCFEIDSPRPIQQALMMARLWYGAYFAQQQLTHKPLDAGLWLCQASTERERSQWLFDCVCKAANSQGVGIAPELIAHEDTTRFAVISQQDQHFRLKKLCEPDERKVKQQLAALRQSPNHHSTDHQESEHD